MEGQIKVWPVDVLHHSLLAATRHGRFVVGGDFNAASAFDDHYAPGSDYYGYRRLFKRFASGTWRDTRPADLREQQTYDAPGRYGYQLDHAWADEVTAASVRGWRVVQGVTPSLSDHAPVEMFLDLG